MRISESFEDYITYLVVEKGDLKSTIDTYLDDLKSFIEAVGDKEVRELKLDDISFFMRYLSSKNIINYSKNYHHTRFLSILK